MKINDIDFCKSYVTSVSIKLQDRTDEKDIYTALLKEMWNKETKSYTNREVDYSEIRGKLHDSFLMKKIKESVNDGYLKVNHGALSFASEAIMNAVIKIEQ